MPDQLTAQVSANIHARVSRIWDALTDPAIVEKYFFGTHLETDWQPGSPISYSGEHEGKSYHDKGTVLEIIPEKKIRTSYWSELSGIEDKPENYVNVTYTLETLGTDLTNLTITQDGIRDQTMQQHAEQTWQLVLNNLKKLVEQQTQLHEV